MNSTNNVGLSVGPGTTTTQLPGSNQTNSTINVGSLVRPGTTQLPITIGTMTAKKSNSISLSPYSRSIDPASSTGLTKYNNFVKSPYNERIDCSIGNRNLILVALSEKAEQYSFAILRIPTSGSGRLAGAPLTINNINLGKR